MKLPLCMLIALVSFHSSQAQTAPPPTDYCKLLARDIVGRQHGFLAGKHLYYVGGQATAEWTIREKETLGFTHPMFRDGRARGHGMVTGEGGTGHDLWGWEFWRQVRAAYATVIVDGKRYAHPEPKSMIWRPDRQVCVYEVAGVTIRETKFISNDDVLCAIIHCSAAVTIEFTGQSFWNDSYIGTYDGDPPKTPYSIRSTATALFDKANNTIRVREGGAIWTKPVLGKPAREGKLMYDGLHTVLSASVPLADSHSIRRDASGVQQYTFSARCDTNKPLVITYAMGDDVRQTTTRTTRLLAAPEAQLANKTKSVNRLLNEQVPYFRCSDEDAVKVYYYLWSLYFMYFTDGEGWEKYPHTQTAVNNFMGLHLWDSSAYTAMGAWVRDKWAYGHGNVLAWRAMVPLKNEIGAMPDNFGTRWYSPETRMNFAGTTEYAWRQYEQSGDRRYLAEVYDRVLRPLYWKRPQSNWGIEINALDALIQMARELERPDDVAHWQAMRPAMVEHFHRQWEAHLPDYYAPRGTRWKDIWHLASLMSVAMPDDWVRRMTDRWIMNTEDGFLGRVPVEIRPPDTPENGPFAVSSMSSWLAIEGMFRHGCGAEAQHCALAHLRGMHRDFGYPIAPESWDSNSKPWGSMYYDWDGAMIPVMLERLAGIRYSIPDQTFVVRDHLPDHWTFVETRTPTVLDGKTTWTRVRIDRTTSGKTIQVDGCPLDNVLIQSWLEDRPLTSKQPVKDGYAAIKLPKAANHRVELELDRRSRAFNTLALLEPHATIFSDSLDVKIENLHFGDVRLRYTLDGSTPTERSPLCPEKLKLIKTTRLTLRGFSGDGTRFRPMHATFRRIALQSAARETATRPGLQYKYYEGKWKRLPPFDELKPHATGVVTSLDLSAGRAEHFAMRFSGYIEVPENAVYTFILRSDDGSRLRINGETVANLESLSKYDAWEVEGPIGLKAGRHRLELDYFQYDHRKKLSLDYRIGDGKRQHVTSKMFSHAK